MSTKISRTPYMQKIMDYTYPGVAIEAIRGGFSGSWERLVAKHLMADAKNNHSEATVIMQDCGNDPMKAAYLITNSIITP